MRYWLPAILMLSLPALASADNSRCQISFDTATLDVCNNQISPVHESLMALADVDAYADSPLRIVKFDAPITLQQRQALEGIGANILGYAPHYAYLVRMEPALDRSALAIEGVLWSGPYLPIWKLDINLANDLASEARGGKGTSIIEQGGLNRLTVALHPGADSTRSLDSITAISGLDYQVTEQGFDHQRYVIGFQRAQLMDSVHALARQYDVASVSLRWDNEFMNSQAGGLHQSGSVASLPIFEQGIFGCGQIVAAADSGLHATHCAFSDTSYGQPVTSVCATGSSCTAVTPDFDHRKIGAHYKWDGSTTGGPADNQGHGTHVMGSLTGQNPADAVDCDNFTSAGGLTDLDGTAPGAKLISQEMGASLQYLNTLGGTIYHAATIAYDNGARVHNNSWGSSCRSGLLQTCVAGCQVEYRPTSRDADRAVWDFPELALFVAAGNSGGLGGNSGCGPGADVGSGGNAKNVFSIGSNNRGTAGNNMSGFSSRGPTQDRRSKPDLTAQGASIQSASRTACGVVGNSGTSMATPTAAGLAALVREYLARGFYPSGAEVPAQGIANPSAALIKAIMVNGAQEITGTGTTGGAPSQSQGWGRINLDNALYFDGDARNLWLHDSTAGLQTGGVDTHQVVAEAGQPLIFTMTFHDAPALVNANPHTVNSLRLEVQTPSGDIWTQKLPATGGLNNPNPFQSTDTTGYDNLNNVHQIRLDTPSTGVYQVRVRGIQVAEGPQPYALAVTGNLTGLTDPDFLLQANPGTVAICAGDTASYDVGVFSFEGFDDLVTLSVLGLPGAASSDFSVNPVTPADPAAQSVLEIGNTGAVATGSYPMSLQGASSGPGFPAATNSINLNLDVVNGAPAASNLLTPANNATDQSVSPSFSWSASGSAAGYRIQVATDAGFSNIVIDEVITGTSFSPASALSADTTYFWRVTGQNACGDGATSAVFSFSTANTICSTPNVAIPDNAPAGVSDTLMVGNTGTLENLVVQLDIEHTWVGDLRVELTHVGSGVAVDLVNRPGFTGSGFGCSGNDMDLFLDDDATLSIQNNCTAGPDPTQAFIAGESYTPANPLAGFSGLSLNGSWTLRVVDNAGGDTGTLNGWCLLPSLESAPPPKGEADLGLSMFATPDPVEAGEELNMLVQVANFGPDSATGVSVEMELPASLIFSKVNTLDEEGEVVISGTMWTCAQVDTTLTCELPDPLSSPGMAPTMHVVTTVDPETAPGKIEITASASAEQDDPETANNSATASVTVIGESDVIFAHGFE